MTERRHLVTIIGLTLVILVFPITSGAQEPKRTFRVCSAAINARAPIEHLFTAFEDAMRGLGYVRGRNIVFERRFADGRVDLLPSLTAELASLGCDLFLAGVNPAIIAAKRTTSTIPIVMVASREPVRQGFIDSLAKPGGNVTGLTGDVTPAELAKNLQILMEAVPRASRVAVLYNELTTWNPSDRGGALYWQALTDAARSLRLTIHPVSIRHANDFADAFATIASARVNALLVLGEPVTFGGRTELADRAKTLKLPLMSQQREFVDAGALMAYGANIVDLWRKAAGYVDKILKGARPGNLPVEQPTKFELVINAKTAKALSLTLPRSLLLQADQVIE